jgi:hypothetical protein
VAKKLEYYCDNGIWPEQNGVGQYSMQDDKLVVEWRMDREEEGSPASVPRLNASAQCNRTEPGCEGLSLMIPGSKEKK